MCCLLNFTPSNKKSRRVSLLKPTQRFRHLHHKLDNARVGPFTLFIFRQLTRMWLWPRCDEISLEGNNKPMGMVRSKYTHAQKMRASMTHIFGRDFGLGKQDWTKNEQTGRMTGNPSTSHLLGTYMVSLRNRKVRNFPALYFLLLRILYTHRFVQVTWLLAHAQLPQYVYHSWLLRGKMG